jgi:hypothetical protein
MEPLRAVEAHNGGLKAQTEPWTVFRPVVAYIRITLMGIRIRVKVKNWNRICIKVMRVRNPGYVNV